MEKKKIALIRDAGYPIGTPAPLHATCICGAHIQLLDFKSDFVCVNCDREYTRDGWVKGSR